MRTGHKIRPGSALFCEFYTGIDTKCAVKTRNLQKARTAVFVNPFVQAIRASAIYISGVRSRGYKNRKKPKVKNMIRVAATGIITSHSMIPMQPRLLDEVCDEEAEHSRATANFVRKKQGFHDGEEGHPVRSLKSA